MSDDTPTVNVYHAYCPPGVKRVLAVGGSAFIGDEHACSAVTLKCWQQRYESAGEVVGDIESIERAQQSVELLGLAARQAQETGRETGRSGLLRTALAS
jgi:hypothetical protein